MTPAGVRMNEHATAARPEVPGQRPPNDINLDAATSALTGRPADISPERKSDPVNGWFPF
jgi:hypothetical protein